MYKVKSLTGNASAFEIAFDAKNKNWKMERGEMRIALFYQMEWMGKIRGRMCWSDE